MLITFSGLDGAGKSTLIHLSKKALEKENYRVTVLTMYDHVGLYAIIRFIRDRVKAISRRMIGRQTLVDEVSNDPDRLGISLVRHGWFMGTIFKIVRSSTVKRFVYIFDLCILILYRINLEKFGNRILILDRYFYDSLADVSDGRRWFNVRLLLFLTPIPELPVFVDVSPEEAYTRKGEYSVEYLTERRAKYERIFGWVPRGFVLANEDLNKTWDVLNAAISERINGL